MQDQEPMEVLAGWRPRRISPSARRPLAEGTFQACGMPQDFPPFLAAACTLFLAVAFRVHDGSKSWAREKLFENGLSEEASSPAISRGLPPQ